MAEHITAAALLVGSKVWHVPKPGRHSDLYDRMPSLKGRGEEGFLTSSGRFVNREAARKIAEEAGQMKRKNPHPSKLFSEDVW